tara:strand:+ start:253 stop:1266 length:1014 start_codon:yes stop_codon:yes gene_type:complete
MARSFALVFYSFLTQHMPGRRLADGAIVRESSSSWLHTALMVGLPLAAVASCPSHDSFASYLSAMASHPSGLLGGLSSLMESVTIAMQAESTSWLLFRVARYKGELYLGLFGTWVPTALDVELPSLPRWASLPSMREPWELVCSQGRSPHEAFVLACVVFFLLWQTAPRQMYRHAVCSLRAVQRGRVWVVLTANLSHASGYHLLHNALQLLHFGPLLRATFGCERLSQLMVCAAVSSSSASLLWNGVLHNRPGEGSLGASGVVLSLVAANAALFPTFPVRMYGIDMTATQQLLVYLSLDVLASRDGHALDASAHVGGAACGWYLAKRWRGGGLGTFF